MVTGPGDLKLGVSVPIQVTLGEMALGLWVLDLPLPPINGLYSQSYHQLRGHLGVGLFPYFRDAFPSPSSLTCRSGW